MQVSWGRRSMTRKIMTLMPHKTHSMSRTLKNRQRTILKLSVMSDLITESGSGRMGVRGKSRLRSGSPGTSKGNSMMKLKRREKFFLRLMTLNSHRRPAGSTS